MRSISRKTAVWAFGAVIAVGGGDAVHYLPRGSYGWNQSLGCVELPWSTSHEAYDLLSYGTLVTVTPE